MRDVTHHLLSRSYVENVLRFFADDSTVTHAHLIMYIIIKYLKENTYYTLQKEHSNRFPQVLRCGCCCASQIVSMRKVGSAARPASACCERRWRSSGQSTATASTRDSSMANWAGAGVSGWAAAPGGARVIWPDTPSKNRDEVVFTTQCRTAAMSPPADTATLLSSTQSASPEESRRRICSSA